jgi:hypothetical protein
VARPQKPPVGTAERLQMDLADYGPVFRFVRDQIKAAGGKRGSRHEAIKKAAKEFRIDHKTAERHYERIRKFDNQEGLGLLAGALLRESAPLADEYLRVVKAAFSSDELHQLGDEIDPPFLLQLAKERLELIELHKRRKRK